MHPDLRPISKALRGLVAAVVAAGSLVAAGVPVAAATVEDTIAAETFRFVNDEREARGATRTSPTSTRPRSTA